MNGSSRIGERLQGTRVETGVGQGMTLVEHHKSYQRMVRRAEGLKQTGYTFINH